MFNLEQDYVKYYINKKELQLNLGLKANITKTDSIKPKKEFLLGVSYLKTFFTFSTDKDYFSLPYYASRVDSKSFINSFGYGLNFRINRKKIAFLHELSYSKIDINLIGNRTYQYLYKFENPFLVEEYDIANYSYRSTKNEFRFASSIGYCLFKNSKIQITPFLGLNYVKNTKSTIQKDNYYRRKYSEYYYTNQPVPQNVISDSITIGKASDYLKDYQFIDVNPKISLLFTFQITPKIFLSFNIDRIFNARNQVDFINYTDNHKYQFNYGLYYSIYKNKGIKKETLKHKL